MSLVAEATLVRQFLMRWASSSIMSSGLSTSLIMVKSRSNSS